MNDIEKIELELLGRALFGKETILPETVDWEALYKESELQTISLLIYDCLTDEERMSMPQKIKDIWNESITRHVWLNEKIMAEQTEVIRLLQEQGIPCAILKGSSAAMNYPMPHLRLVGDIDLLVKPEQQLEAVQILQSKGYEDILDEEHHCHMTISKEYITVEIHKEPNGLFLIKDELLQNKVRDLYTDAVDNWQLVGGIPVLSDIHQAVVLIIHKMEHFLAGDLGLRQLADWAMFVNERMTEDLWLGLKPLLKQFGLLQFTGCITRACIEYLSLPEVRAPWAMEFDGRIAVEIIERIVQSGNFGRKENAYGQRYFVDVSSSNRIASFWKLLIPACKYHWPICEKYPILMPIAPFVIYGKYLKLHREGKRPKIEPLRLYRKADAKQKLYQKIAPFVPEIEHTNEATLLSNEQVVQSELISLVRRALHNQSAVITDVKMSKDRAEVIMRYAFKQGLSMFLNEYSVFREVMQEDGQLRKVLVEFYQHVLLQEELKAIMTAFEENQIPCVLLKGVQTCKYYPKPELRSMGDIDLLYLPEQTKKVQKVMEELEYTHEGNTAKHDHYRKKRIIVEMHKTLCVPEWKESDYFKDIWDRVLNKDGYKYIYEMSLEDHYLFTFTHLLEHFRDGGIGIRMVLDVFILSKVEGINHGYVDGVIEQLGYTVFHSYIRCLAETWFSKEKNVELSRDLAELGQYIMQGGVFGNVKNSETNVQLQHKGRIAFLIKVIFPNYDSMQTVYPWLQSKIFLPAAWSLRWIQAAISRRENVKTQFKRAKGFTGSGNEVEERRQFFEKIGLY